MSAVAMPVPAHQNPTRPTLRLVPAGPSSVPSSVPALAPAAPAAGGPLRLTRRGRLLRTLAVFAVASLIVSMAIARLTAPGPLVADRAVTVAPGQTLSQIAGEQLPQRPVAEGVELLRELNKMSSTAIVAGQNLLIPAL